eukprot:GHVU01001318.1.p2 GENE.GHVU01001318.1~~GHVU01001318.1.p2  ORF type:complete len:114 (-),score=19.57 GHVU01001318.1:76-417(-)
MCPDRLDDTPHISHWQAQAKEVSDFFEEKLKEQQHAETLRQAQADKDKKQKAIEAAQIDKDKQLITKLEALLKEGSHPWTSEELEGNLKELRDIESKESPSTHAGPWSSIDTR